MGQHGKSFVDLVEEGGVRDRDEDLHDELIEMETVGLSGTRGKRERPPMAVYDGLREFQRRAFPESSKNISDNERYPFCILWTPLPGLTCVDLLPLARTLIAAHEFHTAVAYRSWDTWVYVTLEESRTTLLGRTQLGKES